ncbi:rubrerythrin family protein [Nonomuraea jiangxiensis]|uniref:Rubrerythrin n=1 Tax=Nonomuraea jiangxiensis TaxID=633440 RepID=A0A1G9MQW5_9ACTN|nr:rubrerythrin family protein [Nonomuraea jiangxiensis]SDL76658.1 Rubrerythrin [Nonomuraea jiangxiensis]
MVRFSARALVTGAFTIALSTPIGGALAATTPAAPPAGKAEELNPQTRKDLEQSMRGEAFANASYLLYAAQAQRENLPSVARLFERTAEVEFGEHFKEEAALSGLVRGDAEHLRDAIKGETYESQTMYPGFADQAKAAGDTEAADRFAEIARDEGTHAQAFETALRAVESGTGTVPASPQVKPEEVPQGPPAVSAEQTKRDLDTAMHGEALAYAKYRLYAENAKDPAVARLFRGNADVERREHLAEEAKLAGFVGTTSDNLKTAIAGERYESQTMYPTFAKRATAAGDTEAADRFSHNAEDEAGHARAFQQALDRLQP